MIDVISQTAAAAAGDEKVLRLFYQDLAQPGVKQVDRALSTVLGLGNTILLPVKMANDKARVLYARHMENYRKNLEAIPEEKIIEVAPEIGVPVLEKLEKTTNDAIGKMYVNLLSNASHIDLAKNAHPRFVSVIESLTRDEAIILQRKHSYFFITIVCLIDLYSGGKVLKGMTTPVERGTLYHKPGILELPENAPFYFDNLCGLGLLAIAHNSVLAASGDPYQQLKDAFAEVINANQGPNDRIEVREGEYKRTPFCDLFLKACDFEHSGVGSAV